MIRQCLIIAVCVFYCLPVINAKFCDNVSVLHYVTEFEKNLRGCTVIAGYLKILFMEKLKISDYQNLTFPELTEIRGFLLLYRVKGLTSLGRLFPNLTVIRGTTLITDYSLIIYDVPHLQEIGLHSLKQITRGATRIERCSHLCYVHTLDWSKIGGELHTFNINENDCKGCPSHCNGNCWNQEYCQEVNTNCHPECIGCDGTTSSDCHTCRAYKNDNRCVSSCPNNKAVYDHLGTCVTEQECRSLSNGTFWIFQRKCINVCPKEYERVSPEEGWCRFCGDRCKKVCDGIDVSNRAEAQKLRGCTHIKTSLIIRGNSKSMVNELEENLGMIEEIEGNLKIIRSNALTSLEFLKNLKVINGSILENSRYAFVVFENPNLQKLWDWDNFNVKIRSGTISFHGNPQLCLEEIEQFAKLTGLNNTYTKNDVSPYSNGDETACNYIDLNITILNLTSTNITLQWEHLGSNEEGEESYVIGYVFYHIEDPTGNISIYDEHDTCDINGWNSNFVSNNKEQIVNLKPFTQYAYYIEIYTNFQSSSGGQTHINHFRTLADYPSLPINVKASSTNDSTVTLTWKPPEFPNGILNHYRIVAYSETDDFEYISQRNYCYAPFNPYSKTIAEVPPSDIWSNSSGHDSCNCTKEKRLTFDDLCKNLYTPQVTDSYSKINNVIIETIENITLTTYSIKSLNHFTMYTFLLQACNHKLCSTPAVVSQRTLRSDTADDILFPPTVHVTDAVVHITWLQPRNPNAMIVSYELEYKRSDLEHSQTLKECITQVQFQNDGYKFKLSGLYPGKYLLRVKAVSLAGSGNFTSLVDFVVASEQGLSLAVILIPSVCLIMLILIGVAVYLRYKPKHKLNDFHLITNINPDYAGPLYVEDEWEMERDDVLVSKELGQGTFGMVYSGYIKSQSLPCALKTVNEKSNVQERIVFLNEASIMKAFSCAHHVVKLLGVVSKGQPPLVVMELMARGDLKSFLRKSRDSSTSITCAEMYRMSAEIADGMMYLAAKKFVHRDLAARNCMVADDHTVKIGDFGMTRDIYETDYYRKETRGLMPVRWMSPESLADGVFTTDSDVWSYGVVLWEMATFAEQPYQGLANEQVLQYVIAKGTLQRPAECPDLLYEIMSACWKWRPNQRPLFANIVDKLESNVGQNFRLVSFYHSSEGEEYRMNCKERVYNPPALTVPLSKNSTIHWRTSQDDVSLYSQESDPPASLLSSYQPQSKLSSNSYH